MNKKIKCCALSVIFITQIQACNTPPSRISPAHVTSNAYAGKDCKSLERELNRLDSIIAAQRSQLQSDANIDAGIVAGSLLLIPLGLVALAATGNGDLKNQYAQNLGKQIAMRDAIESGRCNTNGGI